jgi:hypothetical protein
MRNIYFLWPILVIVIVSCAQKNEIITESSLNGTWIAETKTLSDREVQVIKKDLEKSYSNYRRQFSWGSGIDSPNGTWWFDLNQTQKFFYPYSGPLLRICKVEKSNDSDYILTLLPDEYFRKMQQEKESIEVILGKANRITFHFITHDQLDFTDPDQILGIYTGGTHYLYRISGPGRP